MHFQQVTWVDVHQASLWWRTCLEVLGTAWLQNLILALTAVIGIWTLRVSSHQERRRATVDVILETLDDPKFQEARSKVRQLIKAGLDIPLLLSEAGLANRKIVLHVLSRYEFMAAGVHEGAFDDRIYQRMYYNNIMTDWNALETFVIELRIYRNLDTPFQELQRLVLRWKKHPLKAYKSLKRQTKLPPSPPALPSSNKGASPTPAKPAPMPPPADHSK
jgi:hypothetical protein